MENQETCTTIRSISSCWKEGGAFLKFQNRQQKMLINVKENIRWVTECWKSDGHLKNISSRGSMKACNNICKQGLKERNSLQNTQKAQFAEFWWRGGGAEEREGKNDWWEASEGLKLNSLDGADEGKEDPWCRRWEKWGGFGLFGACYLCEREGVTQGRGAGGGEANSPPLLLQSPGQLFKLHLLLPDWLQQSRCVLTLLHTHWTAPRSESGGVTHSHTDANTAAHREGF